MNREIKFRAWDNLNKKWLMGYEYNRGGFSLTGECILFGEWGNCFDEFLFEKNGKTYADLIIEEYTGMQDLNCKDIFEGDINKDGGVVVWNQDSASFCWNYPGIEMMPFENEPDWCVITTNIHEKETQHPQSAASSHSEEE